MPLLPMQYASTKAMHKLRSRAEDLSPNREWRTLCNATKAVAMRYTALAMHAYT